MRPLTVFFRTLSESSAIFVGAGFIILHPSLDWSPGRRRATAQSGDRCHRAEEPAEAAIDGLIAALKDSDAGRAPAGRRSARRRCGSPARRARPDRGAKDSSPTSGSAPSRRWARSATRRRGRRSSGAEGQRPARPGARRHRRSARLRDRSAVEPLIAARPRRDVDVRRRAHQRARPRSAMTAPSPASPLRSRTTTPGPARGRPWRSRSSAAATATDTDANPRSASEPEPEPEPESESEPEPESEPAAAAGPRWRSLTVLRSSLVLCALLTTARRSATGGRRASAAAHRSTRAPRELVADLRRRATRPCGRARPATCASSATAPPTPSRRSSTLLADAAPVDGTTCGRRWSRPARSDADEPGRAGGRRARRDRLARVPAGAGGAPAADAWVARRNAAWALGALDDNRAVGGADRSAARSRSARARAGRVGARRARRPAARCRPLIAALKDADARVRRQAAGPSARSTIARAAPALVEALEDADDKTRAASRLGARRASTTAAVHRSRARSRDKAAAVRKQAAWALGAIDDAGPSTR